MGKVMMWREAHKIVYGVRDSVALRTIEKRMCRPYHNTQHLDQMLRYLAGSPTELRKLPRSLLLAVLWHDTVQITDSDYTNHTTEEAQSAHLMLRTGLCSEADLRQAAWLITGGALFSSDRNEWGALLQRFRSADLSVLASEPKQYKRYIEAVYQEYRPMCRSARQFWMHRAKVMTEYLMRQLGHVVCPVGVPPHVEGPYRTQLRIAGNLLRESTLWVKGMLGWHI